MRNLAALSCGLLATTRFEICLMLMLLLWSIAPVFANDRSGSSAVAVTMGSPLKSLQELRNRTPLSVSPSENAFINDGCQYWLKFY